MKLKIHLTTLILVILAIAGCNGSNVETENKPAENETASETTKTTDTAENKAETSEAGTGEEKKDETPKSDLKPADIDLEKPFDPAELTAATAADEEAWKGKEVTVKGKTGGGFNKNSDGSIMFYIMNKDNQPQIICSGVKEPPQDGTSKEKTYKGKIEKVSKGMKGMLLTLSSCGAV